ncbi:MAG: hypothetical protein AAGF12_09430 [Myxococcota bacterium]
MKLFDVGQEAEGFIAIGQEARGVIAIGQLALGVVAIGQLARGVFVVGQLAVGVFAVGQIAIGILGAAGIGVGGRWTKGLVLPIFPKPKIRPEDLPPDTLPIAAFRAGEVSQGWLEAELRMAPDQPLQVLANGSTIPVEFHRTARLDANTIARGDYPHAFVHLARERRLQEPDERAYREAPDQVEIWVSRKVRPKPVPKMAQPKFWIALAARTTAWLFVVGVWVVAVGYWLFDLYFG